MKHWSIILLFILLAGCTEQPDVQADAETVSAQPILSLTGVVLTPPEMSAERQDKLEADFESAKASYDADPMDVDNIIWLGRRAGYLWEYQAAIDYFSEGIEKFPTGSSHVPASRSSPHYSQEIRGG